MQIELRSAHFDEAADLIRIHFEAVHSVSEDHYSRELLRSWSPESSSVRTEWMRRMLLCRDRLVLVATVEMCLCGFAISAPRDGFVQALYVQPKRFGIGIGRALLAASESASAAAGAETCTLFASHNAVGFYAGAGYIATTAETLTLPDGVQLECTRMRKQLPGEHVAR